MSVSSVETSSADDRVRHESLGEDAERPARATRFAPSAHEFVNIDWMPRRESDCAETWRHKLGRWVNSLSRRAWVLIVCGVLFLLLLLSVLIVILLLFVLGGTKDSGDVSNVTNNITTPAPTIIPYAQVKYGNVVGIQSIYYEANNFTDHLVPLNRGYDYQKMFILTSGNNVVLLPADPSNPLFSFTLNLVDGQNCDCQVLSIVDRCLDNHFAGCGLTDVTYQCSSCDPNSFSSYFYVGGLSYTSSQHIVERRTSFAAPDQQQLFLSLNHGTKDGNIVEVTRLNSSGPTTNTGSPLTRAYSVYTPATVTLDTINSLVPDYFVYIQVPHITIAATTRFNNVFLDIQPQDGISMATGVHGKFIYIAILATDRFYIVRQQTDTSCVSVLSSLHQIYLYPGTLSGSYWVDDSYMLWYRDRTGVNVVTYTFKWDDVDGTNC